MTDKRTITVELLWDIEDSMLTGITMDEADRVCSGTDLQDILNLFSRSGMAKSVREAKAWTSEDKHVEDVAITREFTKLKHDLELRDTNNLTGCSATKHGSPLVVDALKSLANDTAETARMSRIDLTSPVEVKYETPVTVKAEGKKKAICFDFDGVIHSFVSGWIEADIIPDEPVEGIKDLLARLALTKKYIILVFSSRCGHQFGVQAIEDYLRKWNIHYDKVCKHKPNAAVYIDDLGYRFTNALQLEKDLEFICKK